MADAVDRLIGAVFAHCERQEFGDIPGGALDWNRFPRNHPAAEALRASIAASVSEHGATQGGEGRSVEDLMPRFMTIAAIWGTDPQEKWCRASDVRAALSRALGASHE